MKKIHFQNQLIIGIIFSFLIILGSSLFFFSSLNNNDAVQKDIIKTAEAKFDLMDELKKSIALANDIKLKYFIEKDNSIFQKHSNEINYALGIFKDISKKDKFYEFESKKLDLLKKSLIEFYDFQRDIELNQSEDSQLLNINEKRIDLLDQIKDISTDLIHSRELLISKSYSDLKTKEYMVYFFIFIGLSILIYIFFKILNFLKVLKVSIAKSNEANSSLTEMTKQVEHDNEILQSINRLDEDLRGDYNEKEIAIIGLKNICQSTKALAGTFYIKRDASEDFLLLAKQGVPNQVKPKSNIQVGDGILYDVINQQSIRILRNVNANEYHVSTSLINDFSTTIYLTPIIYENETIGIIELACQSNTDEENITEYLNKVCKILAINVKVSQAHTRMAELYEELQQQTEELEAQQEELRTTNEELNHKTNLLEASEEELRVQQEELVQANNELDEKANLLQQQNEELGIAQNNIAVKIKEVELASKYKSEFMANMSHELRTPLNSILILAKLLKDNKSSNLNSDQIKYSSVIYNAGSDLLHLINDLLDLAKIESGKVELNEENICITHLTDYITDFFKNTAEDKNINFQIQIDSQVPEKIISDEYRIQQIIKNLISNAFKFTNKGGNVTLKIKINESNQVEFIIVDNGIGIAAEKQQLIFEAFKQEDGSTSRKYGGTGLGLSICREIALLLGGKINLKSEVGVGSEFSFTLPLASNFTPNAKEEKQIEKIPIETKTIEAIQEKVNVNNKPKKDSNTILIIEDDLVFADILKDYAEVNNYNVILAHDGEEGIEKAIAHLPKAIILDIMLPKIDGWNVLKALKKENSTKDIPVHMMSAGTYLNNEPISAGAIGFMAKPISEKSLEDTFQKIKSMISYAAQRVLLIEDHEVQSDFIKNGLEEQNLSVDQAFDANKAIELLSDENIKYDCIILDLNLPDKSGLELLGEIKSILRYLETPVIINTAMELSSEQTSQILKHSQAMVLKSSKSNNRLIDEVNLFLNKVNQDTEKQEFTIKNKKEFNSEKTLENKSVLLADDDMRNIFALSSVLEDYNMKVEIANNGQEALDILNQENNIDIVLMDIMMPVMDGYEAMTNIRKNKSYSELPIIAITAKAMKGDKEKAIEAGANDYISKPVDIDKLISLIRVWVS